MTILRNRCNIKTKTQKFVLGTVLYVSLTVPSFSHFVWNGGSQFRVFAPAGMGAEGTDPRRNRSAYTARVGGWNEFSRIDRAFLRSTANHGKRQSACGRSPLTMRPEQSPPPQKALLLGIERGLRLIR